MDNTEGPGKSAAFIYVVDPPILTLEAILLSTSVRRHLPDAELIAYCPSEKVDQLPLPLREYMEEINTRFELMDTGEYFPRPYRHGNKLIAAAQPRPHEYTIFLDTDVVIWQPFDMGSMVAPAVVSAAPEGRRTWGKPAGAWDVAYSVFNMTTPEERIRMARTGVESPPYFNAGVVSFPNGPVGKFSNFGECWLKTAIELDDPKHDIPERRPWLDQIALPIAIRRAGLNYRVLDDCYNLSLTHKVLTPDMEPHMAAKVQKEIDRLNSFDPMILHYHNFDAPGGLRYDGYLDDLIRENTIFKNLAAARKRLNAISA